jgi:hypothetical protein
MIAGDGVHVLRTRVVDNVGHASEWREETIRIDSAAPSAGLTCTPAGITHTCRLDAADATSGLAAVAWRVDGGEWRAIAAGGTFTVSKGKVAARAVDVAGNELVTAAITLAAAKSAAVKVASAPVYLAGRDDPDSLVGALDAVRSANGTVSLDLRPLAVGRGRYEVQIELRSGKRRKTFDRTYKVGRTGALPRIATSLAKATRRCTVTLTVRKRVGRKWRRYAATRLVLEPPRTSADVGGSR